MAGRGDMGSKGERRDEKKRERERDRRGHFKAKPIIILSIIVKIKFKHL